jgi:hypothetical protein
MGELKAWAMRILTPDFAVAEISAADDLSVVFFGK